MQRSLDESLRESVSMSNLSRITCELSVWCKYSCATMPVLLFLSFLFNMVDYIMEVSPSLKRWLFILTDAPVASRGGAKSPAPRSLHYRSSNNFAINLRKLTLRGHLNTYVRLRHRTNNLWIPSSTPKTSRSLSL